MDVPTLLDLPVPVAPGGRAGTVGWLRGSVARFSEGPAHERRRGLASSVIDALSPDAVRARACRLTAERLSTVGMVDLMATVAWTVPVDVLAGTARSVAAAVAVVARAYPVGAPSGPAADRAVADLVTAHGGVADDETAARIGVLVQACAATAGLIGAGALALLRDPTRPVDPTVARVLHDDPPVLSTTRIREGSTVVVPLSGAPFGLGRHGCPGVGPATAIAAGVLDALGPYTLAESTVEYEDSAVLRMPARLLVAPR